MPNTLLARIPAENLPYDLRQAHAHSLELRGDATFFEVFGNYPELYRWYTGSFYGEVFAKGRVDRRSKELLRLRLSTTHGCRFCNQGNRADALAAGLSKDDVENIGDSEAKHFTAKDRAVLKLADQIALTNTTGSLDESLYAELREHFSDAEVIELGLVAGVLSGMAKFLFAFDLVEKETDCPLG